MCYWNGLEDLSRRSVLLGEIRKMPSLFIRNWFFFKNVSNAKLNKYNPVCVFYIETRLVHYVFKAYSLVIIRTVVYNRWVYIRLSVTCCMEKNTI